MGNLLCEQNFWDVLSRNESVQAEIGQILHTDTHTHTTTAKLVVRIYCYVAALCEMINDGLSTDTDNYSLTYAVTLTVTVTHCQSVATRQGNGH